jgi:UDP-glucose 4-epimerase
VIVAILVTGGAGFIGSHAVKHFIERGEEVVVVDNLSTGHRAAVHQQATFYEADVADSARIETILRNHSVTAVVHFAAFSLVGESVVLPYRYYRNNTCGTLGLLEAMDAAGVKQIVFSSTAATYGIPDEMPIRETTPQRPINPYGHSKLFVERILRDKVLSDAEFGFVALRYFNVAGAAADGSLGEDHDPETHLIPIALQPAIEKRHCVTIFGSDYETDDGTCIRDYIHVEDLCDAHRLALGAIRPGDARFYNLGIGRGFSVKEVIDAATRVTGQNVPIELGERRPGDPPVLVAAADAAREELGWQPQMTDLDEIIGSAWRWYQQHPDGYADAATRSADNG